MAEDRNTYSLIAATAMGAIAGLLLGNYLWGGKGEPKTLSKHLNTLSSILEQIEGYDSEEAESLKDRINNILNTIESNYGNLKR